MKKRRLWLHILLLFVTFGIYAIVWSCQLSKEMKQNNIGFCLTSWRHVLCWLLTFNLYNILWCYDSGRYLSTYDDISDKKWWYFGLKFIPFVGTITVLTMMQVDINKHLSNQGAEN